MEVISGKYPGGGNQIICSFVIYTDSKKENEINKVHNRFEN